MTKIFDEANYIQSTDLNQTEDLNQMEDLDESNNESNNKSKSLCEKIRVYLASWYDFFVHMSEYNMESGTKWED